MSEKSTESSPTGEEPALDSAALHESENSESHSLRTALRVSLMGGVAALLNACGTQVGQYEAGNVAGNLRKKAVATNQTGKARSAGEQAGASNPKVQSQEPTPAPAPLCVDTSLITVKTPAELLVSSGGQPVYALYGNVSSALLALKFKSSGSDAVQVGDRVVVLAKKSVGSVILATRLVSSRDLFSVPTAGYGIIFESLDLNGSQKIEVLIQRTGAATLTKMEIDFNVATSFKRTLNALPVVDLSIARRNVPVEVTMLSAFTFGQNAPSLAGTSNIGGAASLGAMAHGGRYLAATSAATWSAAALLNPPGNTEVVVQTVFGETVTPANNHFLEHQSVVIYARRSRTVAGQGVSAYVRYFMYVG